MTATPHEPSPFIPSGVDHADVEGPDPGLLAQREALLAALPSDKLRQQVAGLRHDAPLAWALLFPKTEGFGTGGDVKRRLKMLTSIEPRLPMLIFPGEVVEFITTGILNSWLEQYFMGIWAYHVNRTLFVFTNMRLLLLSCDAKGRAKTLMWQIPYERMQRYGAGTWSGAVKIKTLDRKSYSFVGVPGADRKRLKEYMAARLAQTQQQGLPFPAHADRDPLCAQCASPIPPQAAACPECGDALVSPMTPAIMSLVLPDLGHMYVGHRAIAMIEMFGFLVLLANMAIVVARAGLFGLTIAIPVIAIANTADCLITLHVARKGAFPKRLAWRG